MTAACSDNSVPSYGTRTFIGGLLCAASDDAVCDLTWRAPRHFDRRAAWTDGHVANVLSSAGRLTYQRVSTRLRPVRSSGRSGQAERTVDVRSCLRSRIKIRSLVKKMSADAVTMYMASMSVAPAS